MYQYTLHTPIIAQCRENCIIYKFDSILKKKIPFYNCVLNKKFRLPEGKYLCNYVIYIVKRLKPLKSFIIPVKPEKSGSIKKTSIILKHNRNVASVDIQKQLIIFDPDYFKSHDVIRIMILLHELGHYLYYDEAKCDKFSAVNMRALGYNKSQIASAFKSTLFNKFRKKHIANYLKKISI